MKLLFDLGPVLLFFLAYKLTDIYTATAVAIGAALLQAGWLWLRHRRLAPLQLVTLGLIVGLGGLTLLLHDPQFIKWKPTLVNWAFGTVLLGSEFIGRRNLLERMLGQQLTLPRAMWRRLNLAWSGFFITLGGLNLYVAYGFEEAVWVDFKLYGMLGLTLLFVLAQSLYLARHLPAAATNKES